MMVTLLMNIAPFDNLRQSITGGFIAYALQARLRVQEVLLYYVCRS